MAGHKVLGGTLILIAALDLASVAYQTATKARTIGVASDGVPIVVNGALAYIGYKLYKGQPILGHK